MELSCDSFFAILLIKLVLVECVHTRQQSRIGIHDGPGRGLGCQSPCAVATTQSHWGADHQWVTHVLSIVLRTVLVC